MKGKDPISGGRNANFSSKTLRQISGYGIMRSGREDGGGNECY